MMDVNEYTTFLPSSSDSHFIGSTNGTPYTPTSTPMDIKLQGMITEEQYWIIKEFTAIASTIISFSGIITNGISIFIFVKMGLTDGLTLCFMSLAVMDFLYTLTIFIQSVAGVCEVIERQTDVWFELIDPFVIVVFVGNIGMIFYIISMLTTAYLAVARCTGIVLPFKFKSMFTQRTWVVTLCVFSVFSIALHIPYLTKMGTQYTFNVDANSSRLVMWFADDREEIKDTTWLISFFVLSVITEFIVVICVVVMTIKLRGTLSFKKNTNVYTLELQSPPPAAGHENENNNNDNNNYQSNNNNTNNRLPAREKAAIVQVVTISIIFIVCNLCRMVHSLITHSNEHFDIGGKDEYLYIAMSLFRSMFDCINASVNFYVYFYFNSRFRSFLCCKK